MKQAREARLRSEIQRLERDAELRLQEEIKNRKLSPKISPEEQEFIDKFRQCEQKLNPKKIGVKPKGNRSTIKVRREEEAQNLSISKASITSSILKIDTIQQTATV